MSFHNHLYEIYISNPIYMEKDKLPLIVQDLKSKRDALSLAHEQLKKDSDDWNKCIIVLSLITGMFESMKIQMGWQNDVVALVPIALSSVIASVSALIKFKKFPEQMEVHFTITNAFNAYTQQRPKPNPKCPHNYIRNTTML